ncbi:hypothetical protein [Sulfurimonas marina]|uniref:Uncharacterized protein n=1 Tax=Sulfurimonas marina TaxID=2590551 RepID=A0A7M1AX94_9BACT|nr:hypothetical protein [Sulfurimonas marina]QOP41208.1 hypothetical protein FJR03_05405 [Sulfurimonas marina]
MLKILYSIILMIFINGCSTNLTKFVKEPLVAYGMKSEDGNETVLYYMFVIDLKKFPEYRLPQFEIELLPGTGSFKLNELTIENTSLHLPKFQPPKQWPKKWKEEAMKKQAFEGNGIYISFDEDGKVDYLGICTICGGKNFRPRIGKIDGKSLYTTPLTFEQMEDIFGPPNRLYNVLEVTY